MKYRRYICMKLFKCNTCFKNPRLKIKYCKYRKKIELVEKVIL